MTDKVQAGKVGKDKWGLTALESDIASQAVGCSWLNHLGVSVVLAAGALRPHLRTRSSDDMKRRDFLFLGSVGALAPLVAPVTFDLGSWGWPVKPWAAVDISSLVTYGGVYRSVRAEYRTRGNDIEWRLRDLATGEMMPGHFATSKRGAVLNSWSLEEPWQTKDWTWSTVHYYGPDGYTVTA